MIPEGSHWVDNSVYHPQPSQVPGFPSTPTPEAAFVSGQLSKMYLEFDSISSVSWWVIAVHQENSLEFAKPQVCAAWLSHSFLVTVR